MTRKVTLNRTEVEAAKKAGVPLEKVAKAKLPKRGRPAGSKNKPKAVPVKKETVQPAIDWRGLAQKMQNALGKAYAEQQELEQMVTAQKVHLAIKQKRVDELEALLVGAVLEGDISFEDDDEDAPI